MKDKSRSRRNFLGFVVRSAALGAIAVVSSVLFKRSFQSGQKCIHRSFCRDCRVFDDCELPQAAAIKRKPGIARITKNGTAKKWASGKNKTA